MMLGRYRKNAKATGMNLDACFEWIEVTWVENEAKVFEDLDNSLILVKSMFFESTELQTNQIDDAAEIEMFIIMIIKPAVVIFTDTGPVLRRFPEYTNSSISKSADGWSLRVFKLLEGPLPSGVVRKTFEIPAKLSELPAFRIL